MSAEPPVVQRENAMSGGDSLNRGCRGFESRRATAPNNGGSMEKMSLAARVRALEVNLHEMVAAGAAADCLEDIAAELDALESSLREKDERIEALERQVAHFKELADERPPRGMSWEDATS